MPHKTIIILLIFYFFVNFLGAQEFLMLDNYKRKRIRIEVGDKLIFKVKGDKKRYSDVILDIEDGLIYLKKYRIALNIREIEKIYFRRNALVHFSKGQQAVGFGFLLSGLVQPLISGAQYSGGEQISIGTSMILLGQIMRIFEHKRYVIGHRYRLRIMDLSFHLSIHP